MPRQGSSIVCFTLSCVRCDAGDDLHSFEAALARGWIEITFAPDLPMANFIGVCPECQRHYLGDSSA